jgi:hypothetical protein
MAEYVRKYLPHAVYLDTNALRSAGCNLDVQWINELLAITNEYGIRLCMSELVLREWCEHIMETLVANRDKFFASISLLKHYDIQVPDIGPDGIRLPDKSQLTESVRERLGRAGFEIVENWDGPLSGLLSEAVEKRPPFEQRGKGLCDAVILQSYVRHAKTHLPEGRVLVVSKDSAIRRSGSRFAECAITVDFADESDVVAKLKSLLNQEVATIIEDRRSRLKEYISAHESTILEFVQKTPLRITDWMLRAPFAKPEDRIDGAVESILSIRPTRVADVVGGVTPYGEETPPGRYPVSIFVEIELDLLVRQYDFGLVMQTRALVQPDTIGRDSPMPLEGGIDYGPQEIEKTAKRRITVSATIDAEKEKQGILDDFRIEKLI